jgi:FMN phosphatase YigB (HAD superfamily)
MTEKIAVLIDLDDTLLGNQMEIFLPGYLSALANSLPGIQTDLLVKELMAGTRKMLKKNSSEETLAEVFNDHFFSAINTPRLDLQKSIDAFYQDSFPNLKHLTTTKPESVDIVNAIHQMDHEIIIATNPLFPRAAQIHRLDWAGFPNFAGLFKDITSFEYYHFCKPHPEYYAEIIFKNGLFDMPAVMIGNSLEDDILPAEKMGFSTYWVNDHGEKHPSQGTFSGAGRFTNAIYWLQSISDKIPPLLWNNNLEQTIVNLHVTPSIFDGFSRTNNSETLNRSHSGQWSVRDILQHLVDGDKRLNLPRIRQFYNETKPLITGMDLNDLNLPQQEMIEDYQQLLLQFLSTRTELLSQISSATIEITNKIGMHAIFGPTYFSEIIDFIAIHDREHIKQSLSVLKQDE